MTVCCFRTVQDKITSKDTYFTVFVSINEDFAATSFIYLHGDKIADSDKQDIVTNIYFEAIVSSIKKLLSSAHG